ncbi:MAG: tetratricopeptide repeat protein [Planctomycetes bacterium]|nr:tetratricopeptide repeat protein [Planctomycetota bacterium]
MRGNIVKLLACLLAVCVAATPDAWAAQRTGTKKNRKSRPDADKAYDLNDIMKEPKTFLEREVFFYCRFATTANLFKNVNTRFNVNEHVNFAVWPDGTILWDSKERKDILPTLYVAKNDPANLEKIREISKYELIAVTGRVLNVYAGYPWIQVTKLELVETPADCISEITIQHMQSGSDALKADAGGAAVRHFEQGMQYGLPAEFHAKAYEQIAQAYLLDDRLDKAREYLRQAVEANNCDSILHLALADTALKMDDPGEALAHCEFAMENSGRLPQVYGIMGEARAQMGDFVQAFKDLNTAAGSPGITPREKSMVSVRRARIYILSGRFPEAARLYAAASEPGEPLASEAWLHNEIGLFYERLYLESADERYLDSAYSAYEEASRLNRLDPVLIYNMAEIEFRRQSLNDIPDYTLIRELLERINQVEPDFAPARIMEGRIFFAEEKLEEAEHRYQAVVNQIGDDPMALMALAEAYIDLGRYMDAADTVRRARRLQPWHTRIRTLGKFLEETATAIAQAEAERGFSDWLTPPAPVQPQPYESSRPSYESFGPMDTRARPRQNPIVPRYTAARREQRPHPATDPSVARGLARRPVHDEPTGYQRHLETPRMAQGYDHGFEDVYTAPSRTMRVRPGEGIRVSADGMARAEAFDGYPQDIQASVRPAPVPGQRESAYPVTEVRLHGAAARRIEEPAPLNLGYQPARREEDPGLNYRDGHAGDRGFDEYEYPDAPLGPRADAGYGPRGDRQTEYRADPPRYDDRDYGHSAYDRPEAREREVRNSRSSSGYYEDHPGRDGREEYGRDYRRDEDRGQPQYDDRRRCDDGSGERRYDSDYEAEYDADGYLRFGMVTGSTQAYASLAEVEEPCQLDEGAPRIPDFSFAPDRSPVLIAEVIAPGVTRREMPVRNANVYRPLGSARQPAEIIEKEAVAPRAGDDTSAMVPGRSGVKRADVRLPSTARGVGMTSDYNPVK